MKFKERDNISLNNTILNATGIVRRLEEGTKNFQGEDVPLTEGQIKRRLRKLGEQNEVLEFYGLPVVRIKNSGQASNLEVE